MQRNDSNLADDTDWNIDIKFQLDLMSNALKKWRKGVDEISDQYPYGHQWDIFYFGHCLEVFLFTVYSID